MKELEEQFHGAMIKIWEAEKALDIHASIFKRMIDEYGGVEAAKRLLAKKEYQEGFTRLWREGRLDISMEALVIQERFRPLFTEDEIAESHRRLDDLKYFEK